MRKLIAGLVIGVGAAAVVLLLGRFGWLETAELKTYDWRMARKVAAAPSVNPDIVLVEINDTSIRDLMPVAGRWPWPRALHAVLLDFLRRGAPKVVVVDISFLEAERPSKYELFGREWTSAESDQALADAVRRAGNVILLADAVNPGLVNQPNGTDQTWKPSVYQLGPQIFERPVITPPYESLRNAAAGFGHNFLALDSDGPARRVPPFLRTGDRYVPSLGVAAAVMAGAFKPEDVALDGDELRIGDRRIPLVSVDLPDAPDTGQHTQLTMLINYRAPVVTATGERPYTSYQAEQLLVSESLLRDGENPLVDPGKFAGKIVFIGLTASGLVDVFQTPLGKGLMPGIQLHASVTDSILSSVFVRPASDLSRIGVAAGGALVVGLMSALLPFTAAGLATFALAGGWTALAIVALGRGLWVNMAQPLLAMTIALFAGTAYRYFMEEGAKRQVKRLFGRYVSKDVYGQLMSNPDLAELGGKRRDMTVLFSDIRGFTTVTEKGNPEDLVSQLNEYFSRMVEVVFRHRGTVDKFVGDMVMALFGAPLDDVDHAEHAVAAAVDMVRELGELNRKWAAEGRAQLDIGVGINSGEMIAGNIGSSSIMSYTVIGDNVNLGARLESLNKDYRTRVIISEATRARLKGRFDIRPLGDVVVKGKTRPVAIFQLCVPSPLPAVAQPGQQTAAEEKVL